MTESFPTTPEQVHPGVVAYVLAETNARYGEQFTFSQLSSVIDKSGAGRLPGKVSRQRCVHQVVGLGITQSPPSHSPRTRSLQMYTDPITRQAVPSTRYYPTPSFKTSFRAILPLSRQPLEPGGCDACIGDLPMLTPIPREMLTLPRTQTRSGVLRYMIHGSGEYDFCLTHAREFDAVYSDPEQDQY